MRAVFLDRDGVINENRADHVKSWSEFRFLPGALEAIRRLTQAGIQVFVITNQAIVNRGTVPSAAVDAVNRRMVREIERHGGRITAVVYCPHRADERCFCRKPRPGLILSLARKYGVDLRRTCLIGDALSDMEAGAAAGCRTILVLTGRGRDQLAMATAAGKNGFAIADDLGQACDLVLGRVATVA